MIIIKSMIIKVIYQKETHVLYIEKTDFLSFVSKVRSVFSKLPKNIAFTYLDSEGDMIFVASNSDLDILLDTPTEKTIRLEIKETEVDQDGINQQIDSLDQNLYEFNIADYSFTSSQPYIPLDQSEKLFFQNETVFKNNSLKNQKTCKTLEEEIAELIRSKVEQLIPEIKSKIEASKPLKTSHIHHGVKCDGCGVISIVGNRYKCSFCHDFNYCEKCQSIIDHPHALLKIKYPAQAPKTLITSLYDDLIPRQDASRVIFDQHCLDILIKRQKEIIVPVKEKKEVKKKQVEKKEKAVETINKVEVPKVQEKVENKIEDPKNEADEEYCINAATVLENTYDVTFSRAYRFAQRNKGTPLEKLCQMYYDLIILKQRNLK